MNANSSMPHVHLCNASHLHRVPPTTTPSGCHSCSDVDHEPTGIIAMEVYIPRLTVSSAAMEIYDQVSKGKYTIGLGQSAMSFVTPREDIHSLALTVTKRLMQKHNIHPTKVGRLDVGTETSLDRSKAVKTVLMDLFSVAGNYEVEGLDTINACYGGTAALGNSIAWCESSAWDGRYGIVVCADVAVYETGPARITGGCASVAMLVGKGKDHVLLECEPGWRATFMDNTFDFCKPRVDVEYPMIDGQQSIQCYTRALDYCYKKLSARIEDATNRPFTANSDQVDYFAFHSPYHKLVQKSFARIIYNDIFKYPDKYPTELNPFLLNSITRTKPSASDDPSENQKYGQQEEQAKNDFHGTKRSENCELSFSNTNPCEQPQPPMVDFNKRIMEYSEDLYKDKVEPSTWFAKEIGNAYTASLYSNLAALLTHCVLHDRKDKYDGGNSVGSNNAGRNGSSLIGKRIALFSYGSGLAATMFVMRVINDPSTLVKKMQMMKLLHDRQFVDPLRFNEILLRRERKYGALGYNLDEEGEPIDLSPGVFYLHEVTSSGVRHYREVPAEDGYNNIAKLMA